MQEIIRIDLGEVNCYLLKSNESFILVDTGGHIVLDKDFNNRRNLIEQSLDKYGVNSDNLKLIILTHGDNDHSCNAEYLREKYDVKIAMHKADLKLVESPDIDEYMKSYNYSSAINRLVFKIMHKTIVNVTEKILNDFQTFTPDTYLKNGDDLSDYGFEGKIIEVPGHTPGSIAILTNDNNLIVGDVLANNKKPIIAPNAVDFSMLNDSIGKLKSLSIDKVYPGHGEPFDFKMI